MLLDLLDLQPHRINESLEDDGTALDLALLNGTIELVHALVSRGARCHTDRLTPFLCDFLLRAARKHWCKQLATHLPRCLNRHIVRLLDWSVTETTFSLFPATGILSQFSQR
jgi:hypothetical protein